MHVFRNPHRFRKNQITRIGDVMKKLLVDSKPFCDLIRNDTVFKWTQDHEKLFNEIKERISADTILAIPDTRYPFHVHVDSSSIRIGSILVKNSQKENV